MKRPATLALFGLFAASLLIACGPPPAKTTARKVGKDETLDSNAPDDLADIKYEESPAGGDPAVVGCADGQREGFADLAKYPSIAGCVGVWDGSMTLRKGSTSKPCGDDGEVCGSPADVCATGWHVCSRDGDYRDLSERIDDKACSEGAGPGRFNAAISHVKKKKECPTAPEANTRYPCLKDGWGSEPVCCGKSCRTGKCRDAVWPGQTRISVGTSEGCGGISSDHNGGVLCCRDSDKPRPIVPLPAIPTPPAGAPPAGAPTDAPPGAPPAPTDAPPAGTPAQPTGAATPTEPKPG